MYKNRINKIPTKKETLKKISPIKKAVQYSIFPLLLIPNSCKDNTKCIETKSKQSLWEFSEQAEIYKTTILNSILKHTKQLDLVERWDYIYYKWTKITKENFIKKLNLEKNLNNKDNTMIFVTEYIQTLPKETRDSRYNSIKKNSKLKYDKKYNIIADTTLTKEKWKIEFNWHIETYYSQKQLPGKKLHIPWRHVAKDGTIRDKDGYIVLACNSLNWKIIKRWTIILSSLWPGKAYDRLESEDNHVDIYTNR